MVSIDSFTAYGEVNAFRKASPKLLSAAVAPPM
jgi:hypothetical protein